MSLCESCGGEESWYAEETDAPLHCEECNRPLDYSLTGEGVRYVLDRAIECTLAVHDKDPREIEPFTSGYYAGLPRASIVEDWVSDVRNYSGLTPGEERFVDFSLWYLMKFTDRYL